ncbi:MAG: hypothetical protein Q8R45_03475 [Brevundimonas sp.]|uniref:hypothetical protein n=1 Tax=Brevundimonas sp. TaxID=1871086 RepID=UPI00271B0926|nr:hypothetical protein [Brevundimonas sp.]MDO9588754.1 hypothetical protein [Brevundimonas sp.]MDP3369589.1 hypothetical protein [Brevundimonas sp.]MDP3656012.1 hypothetical protein [Brevundimonas sp.]MDZ4112387.1 hypothetical protein [Brevundimonas sp.]
MEIEHRIDEPAKRVFMRVGEAPTGAEAARYIAGLAAGRPELAGWDWINDVRESRGVVDNADIAMVAEAFAAAPPGPCWTIYVSHDRNLDLWCKVMDALFQGRRLHRTALTPEAAVLLLDALRTASPAPSSS